MPNMPRLITTDDDSEQKIPGYRIESELGQGGMATVYLAIQESLDRPVALKVMTALLAKDELAQRRFLKEGKIIAQLSHPNIVTVYDIGRAGPVNFMAMEYLQGGTLRQRIEQHIAIPQPLDIIRQVVKALACAHQAGVIHRDVKSANILFKDDESVVLSDFGIAKALSSRASLTEIGFTVGTPDYMSPEQVSSGLLDLRSDLYSVGIVLYEMLTGNLPFSGDDPFATAMCHLNAPVPHLPEQFVIFQPIVDRLLAKAPDDRFTSAEHLLLALDRLSAQARGSSQVDVATITSRQLRSETLGENPVPGEKAAPTHSATHRQLPRASKRWLWYLAAGLQALLLGAVAIWQLTRVDPHDPLLMKILLSNARTQLAAGRLVGPEGDNAYGAYRDVLVLDPRNPQALKGLSRIAASFRESAVAKQEEGRLEEGLALIAQGLAVEPENTGLLGLQDKIKEQLENRRIQREVAALLARAERRLEAAQLLDPPDDNAYSAYREVLRMEPGNAQAEAGLERIATRHLALAQQKWHDGDLRGGMTMAQRGLKVDPKHPELQAFVKEIELDLAEPKPISQSEVQRLLEQARDKVQAGQYKKPRNNNAFALYRKVLKIDPQNEAALAGLQTIAGEYQKQARAERQAGNLGQGLALVKDGLEVMPKHLGLKSLRSDLREKIRARIKQHTGAQPPLPKAQKRRRSTFMTPTF